MKRHMARYYISFVIKDKDNSDFKEEVETKPFWIDIEHARAWVESLKAIFYNGVLLKTASILEGKAPTVKVEEKVALQKPIKRRRWFGKESADTGEV